MKDIPRPKQKKKKEPIPVPLTEVEKIFEEAGYDLEFPIGWGGIHKNPKLQDTLKETKDCDKTSLFNFITDNIKIDTDEHIAWSKDPENQEFVKGDESTFSTKFTDKLRNSSLDTVFEWYDKHVLGVDPSKGKY